jgi:hypothetical protein
MVAMAIFERAVIGVQLGAERKTHWPAPRCAVRVHGPTAMWRRLIA